MTDTTIREARPDEWLAVADLHADSWASAYRDILTDSYLDGPMRAERHEAWRERMENGWTERVVIVVGERAGVLVALAGILGGADPVLGSLIDNLHVRPGLKRTGLGRRVLAAALDRLAPPDAGAPLHLTVYDENRTAWGAYESWAGRLDARFDRPGRDGASQVLRRYAWDSPAALRRGLGAAEEPPQNRTVA